MIATVLVDVVIVIVVTSTRAFTRRTRFASSFDSRRYRLRREEPKDPGDQGPLAVPVTLSTNLRMTSGRRYPNPALRVP
jgi:hypothetical protein